MQLLKQHTFRVTRSHHGYYNNNGDWIVDTDFPEVFIGGNIQPLPPELKRQLVKENGNVQTDYRLVYTESPLQTSDVIFIDNHRYEVFGISDWSKQLPHTSHYEYIVVRQDGQ